MTIAFLLVALAFVSNIANRLYSKYTLNNIEAYSVTIISNAVCAIVLLPVVLYLNKGFVSFSSYEWYLVILLGILWTVGAWVMNASIALNDFSFKEIIRQTRVLMVVFGGVFLLGETLTAYDSIGIALIILSVFVISYKKFTWREHISSKPLVMAWASAFLVAAITLLEKTLLSTTTVGVFEYALFAFGIPALLLSLLMNSARVVLVQKIFSDHKKELTIFSALMLIVYCATIATYKYLPVSIAYPIIQSSTVISVVIGTWIFEKNHHAGRKIFAAAIAIVGVIIIQLF